MIVDGYLAVLIAKKAARAWCWLVLAGVDVLGASSANPPACFAFFRACSMPKLALRCSLRMDIALVPGMPC